jgi:hypothetical protein
MANARDTDGDGMSDLWEQARGLDPAQPDGGLDPDADGFSNLAEFFAGTDPLDGASALRITAARLAPGGLQVQFVCPAGRPCALLRRSMLNSGPWEIVVTVPAQSAAVEMVITDPTATAISAPHYYRLTAQP